MGEDIEEKEQETLSKEELELLYEVLFKRIMELMKKPETDLNPFREMIKRLSTRLREKYRL